MADHDPTPAADPKDEVIKKLEDEIESLKSQLSALEGHDPDEKVEVVEELLKARSREVAELRAANANLLKDTEKFAKNPKLEEALSQLKQQDRQIRAGKIRRLVAKGVGEGRFNLAQVGEPDEGYDHTSDESVLAWFKASIFEDSIDRLEFALASFDKKPVNQRFSTGSPGTSSEPVLTDSDRRELRKHGHDPAAVLAGMKARTREEFNELTAKK